MSLCNICSNVLSVKHTLVASVIILIGNEYTGGFVSSPRYYITFNNPPNPS